MIKHDLGEGTYIAQVFVFDAEVLPSIDDLLTLLLNDRLVLIPDHLLLFLEVSNDLRQRLLEDLNLILVCFDLSTLHLGSLLVLLFGAGINSDVALDFTVCLFLTLDLLLMLLKFVPLRDSLQGERLVFLVNLALNRLNS